MKHANWELAEREYLKILKLSSPLAEVYNNLGIAYHQQNKFSKAIENFEKALEINPNSGGANFFLGVDYFKTRQYQRAIEPLEKARQLAPENVEAQLYLSRRLLR